MQSLAEIINLLNSTDECATLEAKRGTSIGHSVLESVCAFANEPGLGGGTIILGVIGDENSLFPLYKVEGIKNPDKLQADLASQTASLFNQPIRPQIEVEIAPNGKMVLKIKVAELPDGQKPLYFKNEGLPKGAFRRIGSTDQHCTEDDLFVFYNKEDSLDSTLVNDTSLGDLSEEAISLYRNLRGKVNEFAEELTYSDTDLLRSLGCIKKDKGEYKLTYTGLLVFGNRIALRRLMPMVRVDYIRVPGNTWVENPDNRFTTVDMRGPMIQLVQRIFSAIADDLPKGFLLPDGELQATNIGLPSKVLREAIVNALIHRTYRENQPIQIIRYGNRLEIKNPGFSLKPEEQLGEPGSKNRNPFIASIFHETNLAETKGSGIRIMRTLMEKSSLAPPTFESNHTANQFTARLLLHHFLSETDLAWLKIFEAYQLNDAQKRALIFVRETGAVDNQAYRQLNGSDILKASTELRAMRDFELLKQKGKGRATYYIVDAGFNAPLVSLSTPVDELSAPAKKLSAPAKTGGGALSANSVVKPTNGHIITESESLVHQLPPNIKVMIAELSKRNRDKERTVEVIKALCAWRQMKISELSSILGRSDKYLLREFVTPLREKGLLQYSIPDMPNHPEQSYKSV